MEKAYLSGKGQTRDTTKASTQSKSRGRKKCYHSLKEGHLKKDCPERKSKKNEASNETSKEEGNVAMVSNVYDSIKVLKITTKNTQNE